MITVKNRNEFLRQCASYLPRRCNAVELGVLNGDFSEMILKILNPDKLFLVDPFEVGSETYSEAMNELPIAYSTKNDFEIVDKRFGNNRRVFIRVNYSYDAIGEFNNKYFDFIYHDASHLFEDVYRDLTWWIYKLNDDGLMCGHDYIYHESFGVINAVNRFCREHNFEMIIYNENGGDYALKRK